MATPRTDAFVIPDEKTPRLFGYLNVIFGALLVASNLGMAGMYLAGPPLGRVIDRWMSRQAESAAAAHRARIDALKAREAAATTEVDRLAARQELARVEARPPTEMPSVTFGLQSMGDRRVQAVGAIDVASGLVLNGLMIAAGAGLLGLREWGRKLAMVAAAAGLARRVVLSVVGMAFLAPIQAAAMAPQMARMQEQMKAAKAAGAPAFLVSPQWVSAQATASVVVFAIAASVYPILVLVKLSNRRVRAACLGPDKPKGGGASW